MTIQCRASQIHKSLDLSHRWQLAVSWQTRITKEWQTNSRRECSHCKWLFVFQIEIRVLYILLFAQTPEVISFYKATAAACKSRGTWLNTFWSTVSPVRKSFPGRLASLERNCSAGPSFSLGLWFSLSPKDDSYFSSHIAHNTLRENRDKRVTHWWNHGIFLEKIHFLEYN